MTRILVTDTTFTPAPDRDRERGLMGYLQVTLNEAVVLDGLTVRITVDGRRYLAYPSKSGRNGARHPYVRPLNEGVRETLQQQAFQLLGIPSQEIETK